MQNPATSSEYGMTEIDDSVVARESPGYLRMSLAAAMTLDLKPGLFYRNAKLHCVNLLLTYPEGCAARCAYCGLSGGRPGPESEKSFIRVGWPTYGLADIIERIASRRERVKRICISMVTRKKALQDTKDICRRLRKALDIPVSLLISPTLVGPADLRDFKEAGADKIGVAVDLATPALFDLWRGKGVGGPHRWKVYWRCLGDAIDVFGTGMAGAHFIAGMGETEREMCHVLQRVRDMGGSTHLFSFYPEAGSSLSGKEPPPMDQYRRIQIARHLIDNDVRDAKEYRYHRDGRIIDFGMTPKALDGIIDSGEPFRTSGCTGYSGEVACNRPFANSRPGPDMRNYPFRPDRSDIRRIRRQIGP